MTERPAHGADTRSADRKGRPTIYTDAIGEKLCELLASGKTLNAIVKADKTLPHERTVRRWALDAEHPFSPKYARAREVGYHSMSDEVIDICDNVKTNVGAVAKAKLRFECRKWLLAKALPKIYGDKVEVEHDAGSDFKALLVALTTGKALEGAAGGGQKSR